jgi:RNA polymerase sigma-70 factor (ECF subfamily)
MLLPTPDRVPAPASDRELMDRLRAGGESAFEVVFRTHYAQLVGLAQGILRDRAPAEDVAQEVMLELWRRREHIVLETSLRAYLLRAARNRALNQLRHQRVAQRGDPEAVGSAPAAPADRDLVEKEIDAAVAAAVAALPERCREVFKLSRVHGLKYAEIAQVLEISVKTVEAQMGKAMRVLRERLAPWLPEGGGV